MYQSRQRIKSINYCGDDGGVGCIYVFVILMINAVSSCGDSVRMNYLSFERRSVNSRLIFLLDLAVKVFQCFLFEFYQPESFTQ